MKKLYLKISGPLEKAASVVATVALPNYQRELRDGLNLGGGDYFSFFASESKVLLVCNDQDHWEMFVEEKSQFPYYCYVWKGNDAILEKMHLLFTGAGIECEIGTELPAG